MGVGIWVAAHFGEGVDGVLSFAVVAEGAVAFVDLLQLAEGVRLVAGMAPHLLSLHEKGVPVVDPGINGQ